MSRTIVIDLAGEEDVLVTKRKSEAARPRREDLRAPAEGLMELGLSYDEIHETMPEAYKALFEDYFRK